MSSVSPPDKERMLMIQRRKKEVEMLRKKVQMLRRAQKPDPIKTLDFLLDYAAQPMRGINFDGSSLKYLCCGYLRSLNSTGLLERPEVADCVTRFIPCFCDSNITGWRGTELGSGVRHVFGAMLICAGVSRGGLTTTRFSRFMRTQKGGTLRIKCLTECMNE